MAKKQTRRSISVSRTTYERLKAFCEANNISMSQLVETRVNDFLGEGSGAVTTTIPAPRPVVPVPARPAPAAPPAPPRPSTPTNETRSAAPAPSLSSSTVPMTSAAARYAIEPPPPIIKPKQQEPAPKPAEKRPDQIFTF
jgi:hypothetical protein